MSNVAVIVNPASGRPYPTATAKGGGTTRAPLGMSMQCRTLAGAVTVRVPLNPSEGSCFAVEDADGDAGTHAITVDGAGQLIDGATTLVLGRDGAFACFLFDRGQWRRLQSVRLLSEPQGPGEALLLQFMGDLVDVPGAVASVLAAAPITSSGGANPQIGITAATNAAAGSMSAADKDKLDKLQKQGPTVAPAAQTVDWSAGGTFEVTLVTGVANALLFTNTASGMLVLVKVIGNAATALTFPAGIEWTGGVAPTPTLGGADLYTFVRIGATIVGSVLPDVH